MKLTWEAAGATHVGLVRAANEDALRLDPEHGVFLVADGMGGHAAGEVASDLVAQVVAAGAAAAVDGGARDGELVDRLRNATLAGRAAIVERCQEMPAYCGMGTTLTAVVLQRSGEAHAAHVGDSRLYRVDAAGLAQITRDHTWVQKELDAGRITPAQAQKHPFSHILSNVLTDDTEAVVDTHSLSLEAGDELLLVTDGLYNMVEDAAIAEIVRSGGTVHERVDRLVEAANAAGGVDNVTVVLIRAVASSD